jgi:DUF971 family protein
MTTSSIQLQQIKCLQKSKKVQLTFDDGKMHEVTCYQLRCASPAADNKNAPPESISKDVNIVSVEPVGNYAVKFLFDDGHRTGIYSFAQLAEMVAGL